MYGNYLKVGFCFAAPGKRFDVVQKAGFDNPFLQFFLVNAVNKGFYLGEKFKFFASFLYAVNKILVVGMANICKNTDGRLYDRLKVVHFVLLRNACLKNGKLVVIAHLPNR